MDGYTDLFYNWIQISNSGVVTSLSSSNLCDLAEPTLEGTLRSTNQIEPGNCKVADHFPIAVN